MAITEKPSSAFYAEVASCILRDNPLGLTTPKNLLKDLHVLGRRVSHEGLSFLTKSLPRFGKGLLSRLESGTSLSGFSLKLDSDGIPLFMGGYLKVIFDEESPGDLRARALSHVLQVCNLCYKLELEYSASTAREVCETFSQVEVEIESFVPEDNVFTRSAKSLLTDALKGFDPKDISPRHGPGAVATGEKYAQKWSFKTLYNGIHQYFPYYEYFMTHSKESLADQKSWYQSLVRQETGMAKVVLVQKDSRGPRLISMEPLEYQYIQQGLGRALASFVENSALTKGHVSFTDQSINANLAYKASLDKSFDTIDMKDASDRVTASLVRAIFPDDLVPALFAVRSTSTLLPNGEEVPLSKYAPMGSALCFPVLSLTVWSLCVAAIMATGVPRETARKCVYVFGDDVAIKHGYTNACIEVLEANALRINRSKSFIDSNFRESCGMDAFYGVQVTPIRLKKLFPQTGERDAAAYAAYVASANNFKQNGYQGTSQFLIDSVEVVFGPIPFGTTRSSFPCLIEPTYANAIMANKRKGIRIRWNAAKSIVECFVRGLRPLKKRSIAREWKRLLQSILQPSRDPETWMVRGGISLSTRWRSVG
jgi:hypothetical protein